MITGVVGVTLWTDNLERMFHSGEDLDCYRNAVDVNLGDTALAVPGDMIDQTLDLDVGSLLPLVSDSLGLDVSGQQNAVVENTLDPYFSSAQQVTLHSSQTWHRNCQPIDLHAGDVSGVVPVDRLNDAFNTDLVTAFRSPAPLSFAQERLWSLD